jgi:hypothetical protein
LKFHKVKRALDVLFSRYQFVIFSVDDVSRGTSCETLSKSGLTLCMSVQYKSRLLPCISSTLLSADNIVMQGVHLLGGNSTHAHAHPKQVLLVPPADGPCCRPPQHVARAQNCLNASVPAARHHSHCTTLQHIFVGDQLHELSTPGKMVQDRRECLRHATWIFKTVSRLSQLPVCYRLGSVRSM